MNMAALAKTSEAPRYTMSSSGDQLRPAWRSTGVFLTRVSVRETGFGGRKREETPSDAIRGDDASRGRVAALSVLSNRRLRWSISTCGVLTVYAAAVPVVVGARRSGGKLLGLAAAPTCLLQTQLPGCSLVLPTRRT